MSTTTVTTGPGPGPDAAGPQPGSGRQLRAALLAIGGVLLAASVGWGALTVASLFFQRSEMTVRAFDADLAEIVVDADAAHVTVRAADRSDVQVRSVIRWSFRKGEVRFAETGGTLTITSTTPWDPGISLGSRIEIEVPRTLVVDLHIDSGSGDLHADSAAGNATLRTGSGDIDLDSPSGTLDLKTGTGDINARNIRSGTATARTGSGDVRLDFGVPPQDVLIRTGAGDARVTVPAGQASYLVEVQTGAGSRRIDVRTDPAGSRRINLHTGSGDATVAYR